ncbi:MAG: methanethiol S-methyltransferase [Steroidobacteraceae bacterium]
MGLVTAVYGLFCYVVFLASFLYAIGFIGDLVVPKTVDSAPSADMPEALAINLVLLGLFAVQHSVMARQGFKAVWTRIVPRVVERSTYVLISSLLLGLICWKWQAIPTVVWDISSPVFKTLLLALFALGWLILLVSTFMINHFDLFGLRQVYLRLRGIKYTPPSFVERALYRIVRHPIYLGFVIAFWATPHMSLGHLVFAIATTGYIFVGIFLEERDLMKIHGVEYGAYRTRVPMLLPTGAKRG